jgi:hypothetical protein
MMARLTTLDDVLFPVEECPVFTTVQTEFGRSQLPVSGKKAIVNMKEGRVVGVVSRSYRLVSNRQALDWGYQCCRTVFPDTQPSEWEVRASDAPGSGGHCFIDLAHNSTALDFSLVSAKDRPDVYGPFIRVINSYNGLRALTFDIGFFRKVCKNGMIVPDSIIKFKFTHARKDIGETIDFEVAQKRLSEFKERFSEHMGVLRNCKVAQGEFKPLLCMVLSVREPKNLQEDEAMARAWSELDAHLGTLCAKYVNELGDNAYAVFNAVTEFASQPLKNCCIRRERHSYQRMAGSWLSTFSHDCRAPKFVLSDYLKNLGTPDSN